MRLCLQHDAGGSQGAQSQVALLLLPHLTHKRTSAGLPLPLPRLPRTNRCSWTRRCRAARPSRRSVRPTCWCRACSTCCRHVQRCTAVRTGGATQPAGCCSRPAACLHRRCFAPEQPCLRTWPPAARPPAGAHPGAARAGGVHPEPAVQHHAGSADEQHGPVGAVGWVGAMGGCSGWVCAVGWHPPGAEVQAEGSHACMLACAGGRSACRLAQAAGPGLQQHSLSSSSGCSRPCCSRPCCSPSPAPQLPARPVHARPRRLARRAQGASAGAAGRPACLPARSGAAAWAGAWARSTLAVISPSPLALAHPRSVRAGGVRGPGGRAAGGAGAAGAQPARPGGVHAQVHAGAQGACRAGRLAAWGL